MISLELPGGDTRGNKKAKQHLSSMESEKKLGLFLQARGHWIHSDLKSPGTDQETIHFQKGLEGPWYFLDPVSSWDSSCLILFLMIWIPKISKKERDGAPWCTMPIATAILHIQHIQHILGDVRWSYDLASLGIAGLGNVETFQPHGPSGHAKHPIFVGLVVGLVVASVDCPELRPNSTRLAEFFFGSHDHRSHGFTIQSESQKSSNAAPQDAELREFSWASVLIPSGKHTKNYGKLSFFMGKSTISTGPFSIAMLT